MKKFTFFSTTLVLLVALLFQTSCRKGDTGPEGKAGTTGAQGAQGVQGVQGTNGKDANVFGKVYNFQASDWVKVPKASGSKYDYRILVDVPAITQNVVDRGIVSVYVSNGNGGFEAMPYSYSYAVGTSTFTGEYRVIHFLGGVAIYKVEVDGLPLQDSAKSFKIVVISPSGLAAHPDVDFKNYSKVVEAFNLND